MMMKFGAYLLLKLAAARHDDMALNKIALAALAAW
jgi:hypothetical protein